MRIILNIVLTKYSFLTIYRNITDNFSDKNDDEAGTLHLTSSQKTTVTLLTLTIPLYNIIFYFIIRFTSISVRGQLWIESGIIFLRPNIHTNKMLPC